MSSPSSPLDGLKAKSTAEILQLSIEHDEKLHREIYNAELQRRQIEFLERQAIAAERAADATARYTRYTFWVVVFTALVAAIAVADLVLG